MQYKIQLAGIKSATIKICNPAEMQYSILESAQKCSALQYASMQGQTQTSHTQKSQNRKLPQNALQYRIQLSHQDAANKVRNCQKCSAVMQNQLCQILLTESETAKKCSKRFKAQSRSAIQKGMLKNHKVLKRCTDFTEQARFPLIV